MRAGARKGAKKDNGRIFSKGLQAQIDDKRGKANFRAEMDGYYSPESRPDYGGESTIENMTIDGDSATGYHKRRNPYVSDYQKAAALVDGGCFACYYSDQMKMLGKIYGDDNVEKWDGGKIHSTYKNLIAREYAAMVRERGGTE